MEEPINGSNIPRIDSVEQLAEFWDTHDITDFEDQLEEVKEPVFHRASTHQSGSDDYDGGGERRLQMR